MEIKAKEKEDTINKTNIEWVRSQDNSQGFTSNPVRGECPVGCPYCYVKPFRTRYGWHKDIRFYPSELEAIRKRKKPAGIFIGSTIELFHDKTIQYMLAIMETIKLCPQHRFYLLTKQPQNLPQWSPFPENCWVGVTATNPQMFYEAQEYLEKVVATVRYISLEPYLERIWTPQINAGVLDWLIIGACTGRMVEIAWLCGKYPDLTPMPYGKIWTAQPPIEWLEEIVRAADKASIPVFLKDNLKPLYIAHTKAQGQICTDYVLRQELPVE